MNRKANMVVSALLAFTLLVGLFPFTASAAVSASENDVAAYDLLRSNWSNLLTGGNQIDQNDPGIAAAIASLASQVSNPEETGLWDTMNLTSERTGIWNDLSSTSISSHITGTYSRLRVMAKAYATPGSSLYRNAALQSDIIGALEWMYANRYNENSRKYDNWFDWELGSPMNMNDIMVMMYDTLTAEQIERFSRPIPVFSPGILSSDTGANRVWRATVLALYGTLTKRAERLETARDGLSQVFMYVTEGDGFYEDGSFIQHNKHPYNGGYGRALLDSIANIFVLLKGTPWEVTDPNKQNVYRWVTDSFEPLIYDGAFMDMVRGREVARSQLQDNAAGNSAILAILKLSNAASSAEQLTLQRMVKRWISIDPDYYYSSSNVNFLIHVKALMADTAITAADDLITHKVFPSMDRIVHHRPDFGVGLSLSSNRTYKYESINNENLKGWYTSDGMLYLYNRDQDHYSEGYWATVNPYRLPGTTVDTRPRSAQSIPWGSDYVPVNRWAGGASLDNKYGVSGLDLDAYGSDLAAKKSWFMFDDEIVALGAGITSQENVTVETIVENRRLNSSGSNVLTIDGTEKPNEMDWSETMPSVQWAHLAGSSPEAGIGYYFPKRADLNGLREQRTGAWSDINRNSGSPQPITNHYVNLWLDHGINPNQSDYSYVLLPNKDAAQTAAYSANPAVEILSNSANVQAVKHRSLGIIGANFWQPGRAGYIKSYQPASVLVKESGSELTVSISDPTQTSEYIVLELSKVGVSIISKDPTVTVLNTSPNIKIMVAAGSSRGRTHTIRLSIDPNALNPYLKLLPAADAYVESGNPTINYGQSPSLAVNYGNARQSYLRFDLSALPREIDHASLKLYAAVTDSKGGTKVNHVHQVTQNGWIESGTGGITWNSKPPIGIKLGSFEATPSYQWASLDVTDYVYSQFDKKEQAGFVVLQSESGLFTNIRSKEYADAALRPRLEVEAYSFIGPQLHQIELSLDPNVLKVGAYAQVELSGKLEDGSAADLSQASVTYSSEDPSVLSVDHEGNVQALSAGISRITATVTLNGVTRTASIEVISAIHGLETSEVPILADAYVASGSPNTNYGSATTLAVTSSSSNTRESYFKFDLSSLTGKLHSAKLMLYASNTDSRGGEKENKLYSHAPGDWEEPSITWNNKPAADRFLASKWIAPGFTWHALDVTSYVQEQMNGERKAGFTMRQEGAGLYISIYSKERPSERPYLLVQSYRLENEWSSFTVTADSVFMSAGQSQTLRSEGSMDDGSPVQFPESSVSYTSSRPDVLTVNGSGTVTALKPGKSTVAATAVMNGESKSASIEIIVPQAGPFVTKLIPEADTYVRKDAYADTNFGTKPQLDVNNTASGYPTQQAYLRFQLAGVSGNEIHSSSLYVSAATNSGVKEVGVYEVQDDSWIEQGEGGMTWNNKPAVGTEALASSLIDNAWLPRSFDVTGFTRTEFAGDQRISIALSQLGAGNYIGVKSRENTPADTIPYLQVVSYQLSEPEPQVQWPEHAVLQAEAISCSKVLLTWTPADAGKAPVGYSIYKKSVSESVYSGVYSATTAGFAVYGSAYGYEVDGLLPGTYLFKVEAIKNDALETLTGPSVEITIPEHSFPPQLPSASLKALSSHPVRPGDRLPPPPPAACNQAPGKIKQQQEWAKEE